MIGVAWLGRINTHTDTSHYNLRENFPYRQQLKMTTTKSLPYSTSCVMIEPMNEHQNKAKPFSFWLFQPIDPCNPELKAPSLLSIPTTSPPHQKAKASKSLTICVNKELVSFRNMTFLSSRSSCCCSSHSRESPKSHWVLSTLLLHKNTQNPMLTTPALTCCCEVSLKDNFFQHVTTRINK